MTMTETLLSTADPTLKGMGLKLWPTSIRGTASASRSSRGFEALPWMLNSSGFAGPWAIMEQSRLLRLCVGLSRVNEA